ncbi:hypothetical protein PLESTM_001791300 [Pleodorina starrii]|nr:hypothetical protein PLESTM_001791300 [Pleodorina starrii]
MPQSGGAQSRLGCEGAPHAGGSESPTAKIDGSFIKPANDDMSYRHFTLPNRLRVLLVSDPTTDKAGAAMDVRVGSLSDPDALPGLAHFTEHMLFYSSEKYPEEDEYTKFISDRGGSTNAYTAGEHTNYHFDINWESLAPALDRFAQFFIAPTISRDGIEREVKAVDSEHGKNLLSDAWRKAQVNKATANPAHPWARFSTGNRETLYTAPLASGTDPRDAVVDFYSRHYSADRCALAVLGRQPLGELEEMVRSMFSAVPNKELPPPTFGGDVFLDEQQGVLIRVVPVREGQSLELTWQVPSTERLFREQPQGYLSHLLGHEGEGSVFALLKAQGLASALWSGESSGAMSFASFFTVHVDLTEDGQRRIKDVAATVFRYLELLRQPGGISERIWEESRGLAQLHFDTRDRSKPLSYCTSLANGLQIYPPEILLPVMYGVPLEFSPSAIREFLELLTPRRVRALWSSKLHATKDKDKDKDKDTQPAAAEAEEAAAAAPAAPAEAARVAEAAEAEAKVAGPQELLTEPVYGTRYGIGPLPEDWLAAWEAAKPEEEPRLHLPAPNRFIPTDLSLADDEAAAAPPNPPTIALAVPGRIRLWHKPETRFKQPKAVLYLDVQTPEAYTSPRAVVMTRMFTKLMLDYLNEVAYPAQQAGLDYNLLNTQSGWQLLLGGYNHKLPELLKEVLDRLATFKVLPDRFEFVREGLVKEYANQLHTQPYSWAMYRAEMLTTSRRWPVELYGKVAASITADELQAFVKRLCSRCFVEGLAAGNLRRREVLHLGALLLGCLREGCGAEPLHPAEAPDIRVLSLPPTPDNTPTPGPTSTPGTSAETKATKAPAAAEAAGGGGAGDSTSSSSSSSAAAAAACGGGGGGGGFQAVSGGWLFAEDVPAGQDENSAAVVLYQVGPDDLRLNALRSLLVHLAKRDAFNELRTRQQLGYIVSLHGGAEHGVAYLEMLVQSNAYDAAELGRRLDDFMDNFLETGLPAKCGLTKQSPPPPPQQQQQPTQDPAAGGAGGDDTPSGGGSGGSGGSDPAAPAAPAAAPSSAPSAPSSSSDPPLSEFQVAVEELAKAKLEKPKKLGDLANRWWSEVQLGSYCFDRQEAEVAQLRSLTPRELISFAREVLTGEQHQQQQHQQQAAFGAGSVPTAAATPVRHCRRLSVHIRGKGEEARAAQQQQQQQQQGEQQQRGEQQQQGEQGAAADAATALSCGGGDSGGTAAAAGAAAAPSESSAGSGNAAAPACPSPPPAAAAPTTTTSRPRRPYALIPTDDPFCWKRGCVAMPSVRALWAARRAAAAAAAGAGAAPGAAVAAALIPSPLPDRVAEEEVERSWREEKEARQQQQGEQQQGQK